MDLAQLTETAHSSIRRHYEHLLEQGIVISNSDDASSMGVASKQLAKSILRALPRAETLRLHGILGRWYVAHPKRERSLECAAYNFYAAEMMEDAVQYSLLAAQAAEDRSDQHMASILYNRVLSMNPGSITILTQATLGLARVEHGLGRSREALDRLNRFALIANLPPAKLVELELQRSKAADFISDYAQMERAAKAAFELSRVASLRSEAIRATAILGVAQCRLGRRDTGLRLLIRAAAKSR